MKSTKIFYVKNLVFNLPEDFNGNLTNALEEVVKYRKSDEAKKNRKEGPPNEDSTLNSCWDDLWNNENSRLHIEFNCEKLNHEALINKECVWESMNISND